MYTQFDDGAPRSLQGIRFYQEERFLPEREREGGLAGRVSFECTPLLSLLVRAPIYIGIAGAGLLLEILEVCKSLTFTRNPKEFPQKIAKFQCTPLLPLCAQRFQILLLI